MKWIPKWPIQEPQINSKDMKNLIPLIMTLFGCAALMAQKNQDKPHQLRLSAYVDGYLAGYSNDIPQQEFQPFITVGARDNTFGVNVAQLGLHYEHQNVRGNVTLHYGDIPQATWSNDFNMIQEANMGVRLTEGLWLDAGFFATHIGTESFLPKNNMLSSTAFATYNEPFYQAGAKLSYGNVANWHFELWGLNGYNSFVDNNDAKSVGVLVSHDFSDNTSITYTNLYGRESEDGIFPKQQRFYQNIYLNQNWNDKVFLTVGFDYGLQTHSELENAGETATMYNALATLRYQFDPMWSITGRYEIFKDQNGFISGTVQDTNGNLAGVELVGYTLGTEYRPVANAYIRAEARYASTDEDLEIFVKDGETVDHRFELLFTMGWELDHLFNF
jgi:hypothetical protein